MSIFVTSHSQALIPKLKEADPNPSVVINVLAAIGEQAQQVSGMEMKKWMDELCPIILDMLQDSSSLRKREVRTSFGTSCIS